jgi:hypothetical protein
MAMADPAQPPPALAPAEPEQPGGGVRFKVAAELDPAPAAAPGQACVNCWNKVHAGLDPADQASGAGWPASWRSIVGGPTRAPQASQFDFPEGVTFGSRMGDLPSAWQQCPKP